MFQDFSAGPIPSLEEIAVRMNGPIREGPSDLIPGLLPSQGELVIAGETNCGKSLLSLEIISACTTGRPLWGELEPTKTLKKVLYVLGEHYVEVIQKLLKHTGLPMPDNVYIMGPEQLVYDKWIVTRGMPNTQGISKFMKWADGCDLIVFDPLASFVCGTEVENDNITMRLVIDTMSLIAQTVGASCIINAHLGKPMMNNFGQETKRTTYAIRGASAVEDAATNIFYMGRAGNEAVEAATGGATFELVCRKYKGEAPGKFTLLRNRETLTHSLISDKPFEAVRKLDLRAKVARIQEKNPRFSQETCLQLVADLEGKPVDTIRRWLGLLID